MAPRTCGSRAGESVHRGSLRKVDQLTLRRPAIGCHQIFHPGPQTYPPSTPNVDQSQVGGSLPEIKKDKTPPLCSCYIIY